MNQLLKEVGEDLDRFDITAQRSRTYEKLRDAHWFCTQALDMSDFWAVPSAPGLR